MPNNEVKGVMLSLSKHGGQASAFAIRHAQGDTQYGFT
jgi:hypothetical protein